MIKNFILMIFPLFLVSQTTPHFQEVTFIPIHTVKDTTEIAYEYYCINNHPNCWAGVGKRKVGIDTLKIFRTYILINNDSILIDKKKVYITEPKGRDLRYEFQELKTK